MQWIQHKFTLQRRPSYETMQEVPKFLGTLFCDAMCNFLVFSLTEVTFLTLLLTYIFHHFPKLSFYGAGSYPTLLHELQQQKTYTNIFQTNFCSNSDRSTHYLRYISTMLLLPLNSFYNQTITPVLWLSFKVLLY